MKYQHTLDGNKVQCTICPRNCKLSNGQKGFCSVRQNIDGEITLTTYGFNTGLAIDPIEKKPLYHFLPGSKVLSFGTLGCNMGCSFCQNWQISKSKADPKLLTKTSPEEIVQIALETDCKSVAFTYNDPIIFFEYAIDTAKECRKKGIKTVAVTAGYINSAPRKEFFSWIDAANIDLKAFSNEFYKKNCLAQIKPILETIKYVRNETNCWLELTTLLIEGENDSPDEIKRQCEWILKNLGKDVPIHFSGFHPDYKMMSRPATSPQTIKSACDIAKKEGLLYVYSGNIIDEENSNTYCPLCKKAVIKRRGFEIIEYDLTCEGNCAFCFDNIAGVFGF